MLLLLSADFLKKNHPGTLSRVWSLMHMPKVNVEFFSIFHAFVVVC